MPRNSSDDNEWELPRNLRVLLLSARFREKWYDSKTIRFLSFNTYFSKSIKKTVDKLPKRNWVHFFYQLPIYWIIRFRCCGSMKVFFRSSSTWKYCLVEKKSIGMYNLEACRLAREVNVWIEHFCECHRSVRKRVHFTNEQWWIQTH